MTSANQNSFFSLDELTIVQDAVRVLRTEYAKAADAGDARAARRIVAIDALTPKIESLNLMVHHLAGFLDGMGQVKNIASSIIDAIKPKSEGN